MEVKVIRTSCEMKLKEIGRWVAVLTCGGFGLYLLVAGLFPLFFSSSDGDWFFRIFMPIFIFVIAAFPLAMSYFTLRRQYQEVVSLIAMVGAIAVFCLLQSLAAGFGINEFMGRHSVESPFLGLAGLFISVVLLLGPFVAAAYFYRLCVRVADRHIFHKPPKA